MDETRRLHSMDHDSQKSLVSGLASFLGTASDARTMRESNGDVRADWTRDRPSRLIRLKCLPRPRRQSHQGKTWHNFICP
ncbi:hypothetical protein VTJ04DRAFT_9524 [Mycothermus thermophilus]|uniref:uncharacterized protein n=1 Tax=Humicola insolens TaxID=85995 RepID=UPI003742E379